MKDLTFFTIEGKILLVIDVNRGSLVPYYVKSEGKENGVYIRIGQQIGKRIERVF